eukprot:13882-Heterococcus_DN1.PRE.2
MPRTASTVVRGRCQIDSLMRCIARDATAGLPCITAATASSKEYVVQYEQYVSVLLVKQKPCAVPHRLCLKAAATCMTAAVPALYDVTALVCRLALTRMQCMYVCESIAMNTPTQAQCALAATASSPQHCSHYSNQPRLLLSSSRQHPVITATVAATTLTTAVTVLLSFATAAGVVALVEHEALLRPRGSKALTCVTKQQTAQCCSVTPAQCTAYCCHVSADVALPVHPVITVRKRAPDIVSLSLCGVRSRQIVYRYTALQRCWLEVFTMHALVITQMCGRCA